MRKPRNTIKLADNSPQALRAAIVNAMVRRGDRVRHLDYGPATVTKVEKNGAIWIRTDDGTTGTTTFQSLRKLATPAMGELNG